MFQSQARRVSPSGPTPCSPLPCSANRWTCWYRPGEPGTEAGCLEAVAGVGKLDQAIANWSNGPRRSARRRIPAALGQAYLQKCATIQDVREQGILAMQADKVFDTALTQDPSNWEARFTKAVAMSYWPTNLNKGDEVISIFKR